MVIDGHRAISISLFTVVTQDDSEKNASATQHQCVWAYIKNRRTKCVIHRHRVALNSCQAIF